MVGVDAVGISARLYRVWILFLVPTFHQRPPSAVAPATGSTGEGV
jgi:hypothetical protein